MHFSLSHRRANIDRWGHRGAKLQKIPFVKVTVWRQRLFRSQHTELILSREGWGFFWREVENGNDSIQRWNDECLPGWVSNQSLSCENDPLVRSTCCPSYKSLHALCATRQLAPSVSLAVHFISFLLKVSFICHESIPASSVNLGPLITYLAPPPA